MKYWILNLLASAVMTTARLSHYDPSICSTHPINCWNPSRWWTMYSGRDARDWYERACACPVEYPIGTIFVFPNLESVVCLDRGGGIKNGLVLDILSHQTVPPTSTVYIVTPNIDIYTFYKWYEVETPLPLTDH